MGKKTKYPIIGVMFLFFFFSGCVDDFSDSTSSSQPPTVSVPRKLPVPMDAICDLSLFGEKLRDHASTTNTGDIDGDGYTDLIVGAQLHNSKKGRAYLYYGGPNGLSSNPDAFFDGEFESNLGWSIGVGDIDNDGHDDIILSGAGYDSARGRAYLYWGASRASMDTRADLVFEGEGPKDDRFSFSWDHIPVEDIDGDGYADILIPATTYPTDVPVGSGIGRCYLYWGDTKDKMNPEADLIFSPPDGGGWFGVGLDIGDIDNDGYKDIVIGSITYPTKDTRYGRAYLYWGNPKATMDATADMIFQAENATESQDFGVNVGIGDVDNDSHEDIVIGAYTFHNTQGRAYLYWGASKASMDTDYDLVFTGEAGPGGFAELCICDGDVNADGYADVLITAHLYDNLRGRAYLYLGDTKERMDAHAELILTGENEGDWFGDPPGSSFGDFNNDGYDDVAIGALLWQSNSGQGRVYVYYGGPTILADEFTGEPIQSLHRAASDGDIDLVKSLVSRGEDVDSLDEAHRTPLHSAALQGRRKVVEALIAKGANVNAKDKWGYTPLQLAIFKGREEIMELLIENGADVSLDIVARLGDLARVKKLIEEGANVNAKDNEGMTPLHHAAEKGHKKIVELLLAHGADVNAGANYNQTAAEMAMWNNYNEIVQLLISKGADISPLQMAIYLKDEVKAKSLIEGGADVNKRTPYGTTPLDRAINAGLTDIVRLLLDTGADVNSKDNWDWTPLHSAVYKNKDMVELLLAKGANVNAQDGDNRTPLWYAKQQGHTEIVELLKEYGAKE